MSLASKIFIVFSISIALLLATTLYLVGMRTEQYAMQAISKELHHTQYHFQQDLEKRQYDIERIANIITTDQKFRSFLSNMKDNYYPFIAELGKGVDADFVFMVDDEIRVRAMYPNAASELDLIENQLDDFQLTGRIDLLVYQTAIISLQKRLFNVHFIPLKESEVDDYAVALIVVAKEIDNAWVTRLLANKKNVFQAVFFSDGSVSASNVPKLQAEKIVQHNHPYTGEMILNGMHYITQLVYFGNSKNGYILSANLDKALIPFKQLEQQILSIGIGIVCIGALAFFLLSRRIINPLQLIVSGTKEIGKGNYDHVIDYQSADEIGRLAIGFNQMTAELKEKALLRSTLDYYIDPEIAKDLMNHPEKLKLGGERCRQCVLFSDIEDFTHLSETLSAQDLLLLLNEYFTAMHEEVNKHHGILDKFIGDAVMVFWSPLFNKGHLPRQACLTALAMQKKLAGLQSKWQQKYGAHINIRIGIAMGEMIVGNIGSDKKWDYTCIGDAVNYSSRLESLNKFYGTQIIVDANIYYSLKDFSFRELDTVQVKGRDHGERIFELFLSGNTKKREQVDQYQQALNLYRAGEFKAAADLFAGIDDDVPSKIMLKRCLEMQSSAPKLWDSVFVMDTK